VNSLLQAAPEKIMASNEFPSWKATNGFHFLLPASLLPINLRVVSDSVAVADSLRVQNIQSLLEQKEEKLKQ
jgi:hypothetical protein